MKLLNKRLASGALAVSMALSMTACAGTSGSSSSAPASSSGSASQAAAEGTSLTGELELQIFSGGYGSEIWERAIAGFQEENPDLVITANIDPNVNEQMLTRWMQDDPPDFVFLDGTLPRDTWIEEGKLMDLTDFYETATVWGSDELIRDRIKDGLVQENGDGIYELPLLFSTYGMWYDENWFNENSWSVPTNYDELKTFAQSLKDEGIATLCYPGVYSGYLVWGLLMPAVASYGQDYFDRISTASDPEAFREEGFVTVLTKLKELADNGYFMEGTVALNHTQSQMQWLQHGAALIPNGLWLENEMKADTPDDFAMRYYPSILQDADQPTSVIATSIGVGIAENAKNKDNALAFLQYLYTDEVLEDFAVSTGSVSASTIDLSGADLSATAAQVQQMMNDESVTMIVKKGGWGTVDSVVNDMTNKIILGEISVDDAVEQIYQAAVDKE